jgi:hypothetical protein
MKRLKDPEGPISLFLDRAARLGSPLLGPILVQVSSNFAMENPLSVASMMPLPNLEDLCSLSLAKMLWMLHLCF